MRFFDKWLISLDHVTFVFSSLIAVAMKYIIYLHCVIHAINLFPRFEYVFLTGTIELGGILSIRTWSSRLIPIIHFICCRKPYQETAQPVIVWSSFQGITLTHGLLRISILCGIPVADCWKDPRFFRGDRYTLVPHTECRLLRVFR